MEKFTIKEQNIRLIFGLKLNQFRQERGLSLKELSLRSGLSVSYLNEIENAKKYPKAEKIIALAEAMDTTYDKLVSLKLGEKLNPLAGLLKTSLLQDIPFELFGLKPKDLIEIMAGAPHQFSALVDTVINIARNYDMQVENFLFAALRSYQEMNDNYFPDLEDEADRFAEDRGWVNKKDMTPERLEDYLTQRYNYTIDKTTLTSSAELSAFRSIYIPGQKNSLLINNRLMPSQKAFILAREIGYRHLGFEERVNTSTWTKVKSFDQLLNNLKASYFAGALMMNRHDIVEDLKAFFNKEHFDENTLLAMMTRHGATPEMFFHRLVQLLTRFFDLNQLFFLRFHHNVESNAYNLTKELHFSRQHGPHGINLSEHYCRRWITLNLLQQLADQKEPNSEKPAIGIQRSTFVDSGESYFCISIARPLVLSPGSNSCVSLGFMITDEFKETVNFWNDPAAGHRMVNVTCERCGITDCKERAAEPVIFNQKNAQRRREQALDELVRSIQEPQAEKDSFSGSR